MASLSPLGAQPEAKPTCVVGRPHFGDTLQHAGVLWAESL